MPDEGLIPVNWFSSSPSWKGVVAALRALMSLLRISKSIQEVFEKLLRVVTRKLRGNSTLWI